MQKRTFTRDAYTGVHSNATRGGRKATSDAEERVKAGKGLDPLVDPKGPAHLGPIRRSLPRFAKQGNVWVLTNGMPMAEETLLDTTGSMGGNVDLAFESLPHSYDMVAAGKNPVLGRYDPQIATAIFNDVEDGPSVPVLCRTQFEMDEKIALQMTGLTPGRNGCGNGKEDPQFGLFGAAFLTAPRILAYGLKTYHFTVSDEPIVPIVDLGWLKKIYGDDVLERVAENGFTMTASGVPDTSQVVQILQGRAHAFFLQVNSRPDVTQQWTDLFGGDHFVMLPESGTRYLHAVKAVIIGLTEGVLDLHTAEEFLQGHNIPADEAKQIVRAVAHIPLSAQCLAENFDKLPKRGDKFREKTDLWPIDPSEAEEAQVVDDDGGEKTNWL